MPKRRDKNTENDRVTESDNEYLLWEKIFRGILKVNKDTTYNTYNKNFGGGFSMERTKRESKHTLKVRETD